MNKVILIGNLTKDPELQTTTGGIAVCRFTLAVQRRFQNSEGQRDVDFLNIVVWRNQAENCHKFLKKGSKCAIVGKIQVSSYEAQDGTKRYATDIVADEVEFIGSRQNDDSASDYSQPKETSELEPIDDDSLPF
ncbi:MAG: single-stranded DNA-binding protein [Clostridia bacterium]|nr:single-stranded DNA-binding protein [Clostridia bacterium]